MDSFSLPGHTVILFNYRLKEGPPTEPVKEKLKYTESFLLSDTYFTPK
jgi:hypothetical protein